MKNGFTLIELLAVIVILAIIALISTPLIMDVINDVKQNAKERTYEMIEKGAEYYIMHEYNLDIEDDVLVPIADLKEYVKNIPDSATGDFVYVKNMGNRLSYYYTGRGKEDSQNLLKNLIEKEASMIKKNVKVNGKVVNKVIGDRDNRNNIKNHVWYSGYLWQVLETNEDGIKMVMAYAITSIPFGETTDYSTSYVRQWLNEDGLFYDKLNRKDLITDTKICLDSAGTVTTESIKLVSSSSNSSRDALRGLTPIELCNTIINDRVGLLTLEDYAYAYDGTLNEYSHANSQIENVNQSKKGGLMGYSFLDSTSIIWLATPSNLSNKMWSTVQFNPSFVSSDSGLINKQGGEVRPVITLNDRVLIKEGNGTKYNPYIVDEGYNLDKGSSLSKATIGQYLYINEKNNPYESDLNIKASVQYRIIDINGNGIKLERADVLRKLPNTISLSKGFDVPYYSYYDANASSSLWCYYDLSSSTGYTNGCKNYNYMQSIGSGNYEVNKGSTIGYFLNDADNSFYNWIDLKYQNIIKTTNWQLTAVNDYDNVLETKDNFIGTYTAKINLPNLGDILSGNNDCGNIDYWYQNSWMDSDIQASMKNSNGEIGRYSLYGTSLYSFAVRPVFYIDSNVTILSGNGTNESPYRLNI